MNTSVQKQALKYWIISFLFCSIFFFYFGPVPGGDTVSYLSISDHILHGQFYEDISDSFRLPGYPLYLSLFLWLFNGKIQASIVLQIVLTATMCSLVYLSAREVFSENVARLSGWLVSLNPALAFFSINILSESISTFLLSLAVFLILRGLRFKMLRYYLLAGIALAYLIFIKPIGLFLGIIFGLYILLVGKNKNILNVIVLLCPIFSVYTFWTVHNGVKFGYFEYNPIYGMNLLERTIYLRAPGLDSPILEAANRNFVEVKAEQRFGPQSDDFYYWQAMIKTTREYSQSKNIFELNREYFNVALKLIQSDPIGYFKASVGEFAYIWAGYLPHSGKWRPIYPESSRRDWTVLVFGWLLGICIFGLTAISVYNNIVEKNWDSLIFVLPTILIPLVYALISFTGYRYRLVIEPLILILVSDGIVYLNEVFKPGNEKLVNANG
jgi:4-amino-4-deoxy-L-arabinose transferase-like glycosyltransferase